MVGDVMAEKKKKDIRTTDERYRLFAKEYVARFGNAKRAYMAVYPNSKENSAEANGIRLISNDKVKQFIKEEYEKIFKEKDTEIEKSKTYRMIHCLGDSDISEVVDMEGGTLEVKSLSEIPEHARQAIQAVKYREKETKDGMERVIEVKMHPKLQALELRAKIQGMFQDKMELSGDIVVKPAERPEKKKESDE